MTRWLRYTIGCWMVRNGVRLLPKELGVEAALYRWIANSWLHRKSERERASLEGAKGAPNV